MNIKGEDFALYLPPSSLSSTASSPVNQSYSFFPTKTNHPTQLATMQFTTIASLLFAAAAASAAPSLQERQQTTVFAQFYNQDAGCHGPVVEDFVFNQAEGTACTNAPDFPAHQSAFFSQNSLSCTRKSL
jgi:hypothetical protein